VLIGLRGIENGKLASVAKDEDAVGKTEQL
jgi:hypothetical protein